MSPQKPTAPDLASVGRYALLFAAFHFPFALALGYVVTAINPNPSGGLGIVAVFASAYFVGWRFVVRHQRLLTNQEMWRLITACTFYMILFEAFGLWGSYDRVASLSAGAWLGVVAVTLGLDILSLWLSFRFTVRKTMQMKLERDARRAA